MKFRRASRCDNENAVARQISIAFDETLKNRVFDGGSQLFVNGPLGRFEPHTAVVPHAKVVTYHMHHVLYANVVMHHMRHVLYAKVVMYHMHHVLHAKVVMYHMHHVLHAKVVMHHIYHVLPLKINVLSVYFSYILYIRERGVTHERFNGNPWPRWMVRGPWATPSC